jgi:hypothetical protein
MASPGEVPRVPSDNLSRQYRDLYEHSAALYERLALLNARSATACLNHGWSEMAALHLDSAERNRRMARLARQRGERHTPRGLGAPPADPDAGTSGPPPHVTD